MPEKPSYLDMLNSIYMGEQRGYEYLSAWADATPDPDVPRGAPHDRAP